MSAPTMNRVFKKRSYSAGVLVGEYGRCHADGPAGRIPRPVPEWSGEFIPPELGLANMLCNSQNENRHSPGHGISPAARLPAWIRTANSTHSHWKMGMRRRFPIFQFTSEEHTSQLHS